MNLVKVCLVASQAYYGGQFMTAPNGRTIKEHVVVLEKCETDDMNSIFHERAWKRVRKLKEWSKLG